MNTILIIISYWLLAWVVSSIIISLSELIETDKLLLNIIKMALGCPKCVSFWFTLIITQNIIIASLISFLMFLYTKIKWLNETDI